MIGQVPSGLGTVTSTVLEGQSSPSAMQMSGVLHPMGLMGPGQIWEPSPQSGVGSIGQWKGQSSPSATQMSAGLHPIVVMGPGQLTKPTPQSLGVWGGHGVGIARAVEKRAKRRRDIRMPSQ